MIVEFLKPHYIMILNMCSSSSSNFISNKYMKTSIYNTIALMITAMFTCSLLVATRKSRGLSSWLPRNVIWSRDRQARPGGADTSALWRSFQGMNFTEWISLYQMINFIMDCIWLYAISSGVFWMSSYIYIS